MNLTPRQIQEKQFHDAFRGYSHEEVDSFLDAVAEAFDHVFRENQSLHHRLKEMEVELTQAKGSEDMLKRMLVTAQETADKAVQEARMKGQSIEQQAASHSEAVIAEAEKKAQEIVVDAVAQERETQDAIEGARRFEREYRTRLRAFIESQLRVLDEGPVPAPSAALPAQTPSAASTTQAMPAASGDSAETAAAPRAVEPTAPDARNAVSEVMRRTDAGHLTNGSPPAPPLDSGGSAPSSARGSVPVGAATPPAPPLDSGGSAPSSARGSVPVGAATPPAPPAAVIRLPQEAPALVAPAGEPDASPPSPMSDHGGSADSGARESVGKAAAPPPVPPKEEGRSIDELFWGEE